jgi:glycosyltransferase involved in cell wall biosynthesis
MKISYCICAHNEHLELEHLLRFLKQHIREEDEVIIQLDTTHTPEVLEVCNLFTNFNHQGDIEFQSIPNSKFYSFPLNKDFASFKNKLFEESTGDYIFNIDADEVPNEFLVKNLHSLLEGNPEIDVLLVPRENYVKELTQEHVNKWGWRVDSKNRINWPDLQWRIYRNNGNIKWVNKVHECLEGFDVYTHLPIEPEWSLLHIKDIKRQEKQNQFYETI